LSTPDKPTASSSNAGPAVPPIEATPADVAGTLDETSELSTAWGSDDDDPEGGGRKRRRRRGGDTKMPGEEVSHLNLTPMMDIMTILLVFLVMSFATDPSNINVNLVHPPESDATKELEAATTITLTPDMVLVADAEVMKIADHHHTTGKQSLIPQVRDALDKQREKIQKMHEFGGPEFDGSLLVVAHETTPYALIADVLYSAGQAQFSKYELVVMKAAVASK
jgi:biopolymer transport protein ExbD